jgi:hypothetical protein
MTYSSGGLIQATDYNGFVSTTAGANINAIWGTASSSGGYGQANIATVSAAGTVTATQWATLVNDLSAIGSHQGTTITARTAPVAGNTITALAAVNTDITNCYTNRNNAASVGSQYTSWTGTASKTAATGSGSTAWTITFTDTITFANNSALFSFFNAGGYLKWQVGKSSTGTVADTEWNTFVGAAGAGGRVAASIILTGAGSSKTINSLTLTGTTKTGGSGTPTTLTTATGVYGLTTAATTLYKQFDTGAAYTSNYVQINASVDSNTAPTVITLTTTWYDNGDTNPGATAAISGGTATTGIVFGTAPTTIVTYYPPETTYLTNTWGTPTVASTVA